MIAKEGYQRTVVTQTDLFEIVSIEWTKHAQTSLHSHGWSQCFVLIEDGVFQDQMQLGSKTETRTLESGQCLQTPVGGKHRIQCLSKTGKTLHVYTPKIKKENQPLRFHSAFSADLKKDLSLADEANWQKLQKILHTIRDESISTHSPYFMNQLFSGVSPQMLAAEELIAQTRTTLATYEASPVLSSVECEVIDRLASQIGWKKEQRDGVAVPGGSAANFMAIHCARHQKFPEIKVDGMGNRRFQIFVSEDAHYSFLKATVAMGLGSKSVVKVPVDHTGRMSELALEQLISRAQREGITPLMVCATAGTTVHGAFDNIEKLSAICKRQNIWLHVDAAWGGPAFFSDRLRRLVKSMPLADSVTFDAHKFFGANLTCSFFLTQHKNLLLDANEVSGAGYLFHSDDPALDRGKLSWQCGRKADALSFWVIWKSLGTSGLQKMIDQTLGVRDRALAWVKTQPRLELVSTPEYLNLCIRVLPPAGAADVKNWSQHVREVLKEKNLAMINFASDENGSFLRLILAHPDLSVTHIQEMLVHALEVS